MYKVADRTAPDADADKDRVSQPRANGLSDRGLLDLAWQRKRLIALCAVAGAVLLILGGQLIPARYNAVAQILIDPSELRVLDNSLRAQNPFNEALIAEVETQTRVLLSSNVLSRVVDRLHLAEDPEFTSGRALNPLDYVRQLVRAIGLGTPDDGGASDPSLKALRSLDKRVWARRTERTYVVDLGVGTEDRNKSVRIANAIVDAFLEEQMRAQSDAAQQATKMLTARLDELRKRALDAEERVERFKRKNNILSASGQLVVEQQVSSINNQLVLARARAADAQARYNQINAIRKRGGDVSAISEATASQTLAALRAQHGIAVRREAELSATLGRKHPVLIQAREQVRKIAAEIDAEVTRIADATSREYQRAQGSEASLERSLDAVKSDLTQINDKLVALRELERDAEASRLVYEASLKRTQEVSEQEKLPIANTRVISRATPAEHRSMPPSKAVLGLAGLMLGALAGFGLVLASSIGRSKDAAA